MRQPHVLLIDNYDSFTYNLVHYLEALDCRVTVIKNDFKSLIDIKTFGFSHIVLSPGPGQVIDSGISMEVIDKYHSLYPILGVCMGHQCLAKYFGARIVRAKQIMHGKVSNIKNIISNIGILNDLPMQFRVMRYHSWVVDDDVLHSNIKITARTYDLDNEIMGVMHNSLPAYGLQFHPESVLSEFGHKILNNFLKI